MTMHTTSPHQAQRAARIHRAQRVAAAALLTLSALNPALADTVGSATSSASSAGSASIGSLSDSVKGSSESSTGDKKVAAGEYRVAAVETQPGKASEPAWLQVRLEREAGERRAADGTADTVMLRLPVTAVGNRELAIGERIWVHERAYGLAFARAPLTAPAQSDTAPARAVEPFFLAVTEAWQRDISARAISL